MIEPLFIIINNRETFDFNRRFQGFSVLSSVSSYVKFTQKEESLKNVETRCHPIDSRKESLKECISKTSEEEFRNV
jgi:hypothetical protein|tara:strand:- start:73 stop:300 length:228 start_codon:yes stop_codon:yes gene_type:complete